MTGEAATLLVVEPTKLLQDLGVVRISVKNSTVRCLRAVILNFKSEATQCILLGSMTYVFLLLMNVANLEPNVLLGEGRRRRCNNVIEALRELVMAQDLGNAWE